MDYVYVLVRQTGRYDYHSETPIGVYECKEAAKQEALDQLEMREIFESAYEAFKGFWGKKEFPRPSMPDALIQKNIKPTAEWSHRFQHPDTNERKKAQQEWVHFKEAYYLKHEEYLKTPEAIALREQFDTANNEAYNQQKNFERDEDIRFLAFLIAASGRRDQKLVKRVTDRIQAQLDRRESEEHVDMVSRDSDFFQGTYEIQTVVFYAKKD